MDSAPGAMAGLGAVAFFDSVSQDMQRISLFRCWLGGGGRRGHGAGARVGIISAGGAVGRSVLAMLSALVVAGVGGCGGALGGGRAAVVDDASRAYPGGVLAEALDIHVLREGTVIEFTNTTGRSIGPGRLWLNKEYSSALGVVEPGERERLDLYSFTNRFGQAFRGGGFFATDPPSRLVSVELEGGGEVDGVAVLVPMVVVRGEGD